MRFFIHSFCVNRSHKEGKLKQKEKEKIIYGESIPLSCKKTVYFYVDLTITEQNIFREIKVYIDWKRNGIVLFRCENLEIITFKFKILKNIVQKRK